jgi:hypothetical protein
LNQAVALGWQMLQRGNVVAAEQAIQPLLMGGAISDELAPLLGAIRAGAQIRTARGTLCLPAWHGLGGDGPADGGCGGVPGGGPS